MPKVLLLLDSEDLTTIMSNILSRCYQIKVSAATNAITEIEGYQPDALVLDLFLKGTDGFTILENIAYKPRIIILFTLLATPEILKKAYYLDVSHIYLKPFKISAFIDRLHELILTHSS